MHTRLRVAATLFAAVAAVSCGEFGPCLHPDCRPIDSIYANVYLCGFPRSQIDRSSEFSVSFVHQGQRIPLELRGRLELVRTIEWRVEPRIDGSLPPVVRLTPTSRTTAVLEGVAPGGGRPIDDVFVGAYLTFEDGTEGGAPLAYCGFRDRIPANRLVVTAAP